MYDGEWFGPNRFSQTMESLINHQDTSEMIVHVPFANCIYIDRILGLCQPETVSTQADVNLTDDHTDEWKPLWLLIPTLLGTSDRINPVYVPHLKALLSCEYCTGIIAGKAKASVYILGYQGNALSLPCLIHCRKQRSLFGSPLPSRYHSVE